MNVVKLPKYLEPLTTTYSINANACSLIMTDQKNYGFLLNTFILPIIENNGYIKYHDFFYRNCPLINSQKISLEVIQRFFKKITDFIIFAIDNQQYVMIPIDNFYIEAYKTEHHFSHALFIYGYNLNENLFFISDNFENGVYQNKSCSFNELEKAYNSFNLNNDPGENHQYYKSLFQNCIELLSIYTNVNTKTIFEPYVVKELLIDYLNSHATNMWNYENRIWGKSELHNVRYGISCYEKIIDKCTNALVSGDFGYGGIQGLYFVCDHKRIMVKRLEFMIDNKFINNGQIYHEAYIKLQNDCLNNLNLAIKFLLKKDMNIINKLINHYKDIHDQEQWLLTKLIKDNDIIV